MKRVNRVFLGALGAYVALGTAWRIGTARHPGHAIWMTALGWLEVGAVWLGASLVVAIGATAWKDEDIRAFLRRKRTR